MRLVVPQAHPHTHTRAHAAATMATREDKEWVASLANHRSGQRLANHLASMELSNQSDGRDCAATESVNNERVFIYAIARAVYNSREYPFGLTTNLPRFIAILNLSGERMLVYSDKPALIRCLCSRSSALMPGDLARALVAFETFPMSSRDGSTHFTLLTYSLPWQSGTGSAFWHLSACAVKQTDEDGSAFRLADRLLQLSSASPAAYRGNSVLHSRDSKLPCYVPSAGALELVSDKQIDEFMESYSATCLDFECAPSAKKDGKGVEAQLLSTLQELQRGRKEDQENIRQLDHLLKASQDLVEELGEQMQDRVDILTRQHQEASDELKKKYEEKLEVAQQQRAELNAQLESEGRSHKDAATKHRRAAKEHEARKVQHEELKRQSDAKDALHNAALSQHVATISSLEGKLEKSRAETRAIRSELEKEHAVVMDKTQREHEEALSKATLALDSKKRIINQLSENNERRDVEVASLKTHEEEQERRIRDLEAEVAECAKRFAERPVRAKSSGPRRNASTSTHSCASTQTDPPCAEAPEEAAAPVAVPNEKDAAEGVAQPPLAPPLLTYQAALDMLQELVHQSGHGAALQHPPLMNGYARPLPFPHFTPGVAYRQSPMRPYLQQQPMPQQQQPRPMVSYAPPGYPLAAYQSGNNTNY